MTNVIWKMKLEEESDGHPQTSQSSGVDERHLPDRVFLLTRSRRQASTRVCARHFTPGIRHPEAELLRLSRRGKDVGAGFADCRIGSRWRRQRQGHRAF